MARMMEALLTAAAAYYVTNLSSEDAIVTPPTNTDSTNTMIGWADVICWRHVRLQQ